MTGMKRGFGSPNYDRAKAAAARRAGNEAQWEVGGRFSFAHDPGLAARAGKKGAKSRARRRKAERKKEARCRPA